MDEKFAYKNLDTVHITAMILRTARFLCVLYTEICVNVAPARHASPRWRMSFRVSLYLVEQTCTQAMNNSSLGQTIIGDILGLHRIKCVLGMLINWVLGAGLGLGFTPS